MKKSRQITPLFLNQNTSVGINGSQKNLPVGILRSLLRSSSFLKNQFGFSPVVVLSLIAVIALAGLWVFSNSKLNNSSEIKTNTSQAPAKKVMMFTSSDIQLPAIEGVKKGLKDLGYIEGQNIIFELLNPKGDKEAIKEMAVKVVQAKPDLIVVFSTSATKAIQKEVTGKNIPVVFVDVGNFKELGITNLQQPGNKITGVVSDSVAEGGKRMEILKELLPNIKKTGVLVNPTHISYAETVRIHNETSKNLGIQVVYYEVSNKSELDAVLVRIPKEKPDAVMTSPETFLNNNAKIIASSLRKSKIPTIDYGQEAGVNIGFLAMYGVNRLETGRQGSRLVDKVLKGEDPGLIPIEFSSSLILEINETVAKELGLTIPKPILIRANKIYNE